MHPTLFDPSTTESQATAVLEELHRQNRLDEHQADLAGVLRSVRSRELVRAVLEYATRVDKASDILIAEVLHVLVSADHLVSTRARAAAALGHLVSRRPPGTVSDFDLDRVVESMSHVLRRTDSPALKKALFGALGQVRGRTVAPAGPGTSRFRTRI
ncbi:MAG: hypothetical protein GXY47_09405 [Acidobacteria bacterium]|nr:hypothetical protein [Acidobacteriota bacterium]